MRVYDLGFIAYDDAFALQRERVAELQAGGGEETLYLLEHNHVLTLGRNANRRLGHRGTPASRTAWSPTRRNGPRRRCHVPRSRTARRLSSASPRGGPPGYPSFRNGPRGNDYSRASRIRHRSAARRGQSWRVDVGTQDRVGRHPHIALGDDARICIECEHGFEFLFTDSSVRHHRMRDDIHLQGTRQAHRDGRC